MSVPYKKLTKANLIVDEIYESNGAINSRGDVLCKLMNVGSLGGFRKRLRSDSTKSLAFVALESTLNEIDWIDDIDTENGIVIYWGDNRRPGHELHNTRLKGNAILRNCFQALFDGNYSSIPPFFYFVSAGGRSRRFVGLLVPGTSRASIEEQLIAIWRSKGQQRYQNYKATFTILDIAQIDRRWLQDLIDGNGEASKYAPDAWLKWIKTGVAKPLVSSKIISYRSKEEQLPTASEEMLILNSIYEYFANKYYFEECAIKIAELMDQNIHDCQHTRFVRDGGRDATGKYRIGRMTDGIDVEFALEAKCYKPGKTEVGVSDISRLISRLRFRQFGILITTSVLGRQAYRELKEDQHPIIVVSGKDITSILYNAGIKTNEEAKNWLSQFKQQ